MKTLTSSLRVIFAVLLMIVALSSLSLAQSYTVTDLGTLGGGISIGLAINDNGAVAGFSPPCRYCPDHAFLWTSTGGMHDLGVLNADDYTSSAFGMNNDEQVVGWSFGFTAVSAFLWTPGEGMIGLGNLGGSRTIAYGVNNFEQVVGYSGLSDGSEHAFLWTRASGMQDLGTLGGTLSYATAINDNAQVVGYSYLSDNVTIHAFLWTANAGMTDLGTLGGRSDAAAINNLGQVTGSSYLSDGTQVAYGWDAEHGMRQLAKNLALGTGINRSGQVVGNFSGGLGAAMWSKTSGLVNLTARIPHRSAVLDFANGINNSGQIICTDATNHALLLTPTKQTSSQRSKQ